MRDIGVTGVQTCALPIFDGVLLNDAELKQLTGKPSLLQAARDVMEWGPRVVVAKQGEYGAALFTEGGFFALPAYPLETVLDPTGAGDSFAGGFMGFIAAHPERKSTRLNSSHANISYAVFCLKKKNTYL